MQNQARLIVAAIVFNLICLLAVTAYGLYRLDTFKDGAMAEVDKKLDPFKRDFKKVEEDFNRIKTIGTSLPQTQEKVEKATEHVAEMYQAYNRFVRVIDSLELQDSNANMTLGMLKGIFRDVIDKANSRPFMSPQNIWLHCAPCKSDFLYTDKHRTICSRCKTKSTMVIRVKKFHCKKCLTQVEFLGEDDVGACPRCTKK